MSPTVRQNVIDWFQGTLHSRLNDKQYGVMILVMQRLHEDDLAGFLLRAGGWTELRLAAIAQEDERICIGPNRYHCRLEGEALHPARDPLRSLESTRAEVGSALFAAQYLQTPLPKEGLYVRRHWLPSYDRLPEGPGVVTIQSWDTASKPGIQNDFSVCITTRLYRNQLYTVDVYRARLSFPDLKAKVIELARLHGCQRLFIEDAASGMQLIDVLLRECPAGVPRPVRCAPAGHKETRFSAQTYHMADGHLLLPSEAPWLADYVTELMGFPNARYDDQADATAQLLAHAFLCRDDSPGGGAISSDYLDPSPDDDVDEWPWNEDFYAIRWR